MILVLGGTTEGRIAVETLEEAGHPFYYSTRGDEQEVNLHHGIRLHGALDREGIVDFCRQKEIRLLVDAAHPFASQLHLTVAQAAADLAIPAIRLERIYAERSADICWCRDFEEAVLEITRTNPPKLLALTGVQTIWKLRDVWQRGSIECYFRILDRDSSRQLALRQGFPMERICYYRTGEREESVLERLQPDAIVLKESGASGGFMDKVEAARQAGIRIFAICRPPLPDGYSATVNGPHGLRRAVEQWLPSFYPLHSGLTTGTCATAALLLAAETLIEGTTDHATREVPVCLPNGETISVRASSDAIGQASVVKESGDDPDITQGRRICAQVELLPLAASETLDTEGYRIRIAGGEGVGRVTLPGLGLPVGEAAINQTPREMMVHNLTLLLRRLHIPPHRGEWVVTISVPDGEELALRTFNPRLGIVGGISIIGTSGIIKPFSSRAFVDSIRKSLEVARATGAERIVLNSGAKSEKFLRRLYPELPLQAFVHYGNYIGDTLQAAHSLGLPCLTLGVMIGKAVKLAEGHLDTHSREVTMNTHFLCQLASDLCTPAQLEAMRHLSLARELWQLLSATEMQAFAQRLLQACYTHCRPLYPTGSLTLLLIGEEGEIIAWG